MDKWRWRNWFTQENHMNYLLECMFLYDSSTSVWEGPRYFASPSVAGAGGHEAQWQKSAA